jgi:Xaa-Pro aminopeptidase
LAQLNYNLIPRSEIEARIAHLRENLKKQNFDGALIFSTTELYYYSGFGADGYTTIQDLVLTDQFIFLLKESQFILLSVIII